MRAVLVLLAIAGGLVPALPTSGREPGPAADSGCQSPSDWECSAGDMREAPESTLRSAGPTITVSCDPRWEEAPVDLDDGRMTGSCPVYGEARIP